MIKSIETRISLKNKTYDQACLLLNFLRSSN